MKLRIAAQLALGFAVPSALIVVMAGIAFASVNSLYAATGMVQNAGVVSALAHDYVAQRIAKRFAIRNVVLKGQEGDFNAANAAVEAMHADLHALGARLAGNPAMLAKVNDIAEMAKGIEARDALQLDAARKHPAETLLAFRGKPAPGLGATVLKSLSDNATAIPQEAVLSQQLVKEADANANAAQEQAESTYRRSTVGLSAALGIALLCAIVIAFFLSRRITVRLQRVRAALVDVVEDDIVQLTTAFRAMANGDLTTAFTSQRANLSAESADELGDLARTYNGLAAALGTMSLEFESSMQRLSDVIRNVQATSAELSAASAQVTTATNESGTAVQLIVKGVEGVAQGAAAQSKRLGEASAALEEVAHSSTQIASGAADQATSLQAAADAVAEMNEQISGFARLGEALATAARDASSQTQAGTNAVHVTAEAMRTLREHAGGTEDAMRALEGRSHAVSEIVSAIDEIADQTNLLALNAAIEAARAGEHGRGFSVVADEIRKLAERASGSTKEIGEILGAIRAETERVAHAMRTSSSAMNDGVERAERAALALQAVETAIESTKHAAEEMAVRAEQMQASSVQVTENLGAVSAVVGENAAATNQMTVTIGAVTGAIVPVAQSAEEQSATAEEVSRSTVELTAQLDQMAATADGLRQYAHVLRSLASTFHVHETAVREAALPSSGAVVCTPSIIGRR